MANINAKHDDNAVPTALFAQSGATSFVAPGQIDQITGRILVDVSGTGAGSVLAVEIPTGTVNGVNTVFTVTHTPVFIEVSGQVMVSSTIDPTNYGFTYSAGTITFVNAPTGPANPQTPHSFYNSTTGSSSLSSFFQTDTFTSTLNQTVFTATILPTFVFSVLVNDQPLTLTTDYTQSGVTFTLNAGIPAGLKVSLTYLHA